LGGNVQLSYVNKHLKQALEEADVYSEELMDKIIKKGTLQGIEEIPEWIRKTFVTSMDINAQDHILMQAAFQEHCDNAISKTINFPNSATQEDIIEGYLYAWKHGCKGCTVYRDGSRFLQVLNLNDDDKEKDEEKKDEENAIKEDTKQKDDVAMKILDKENTLNDAHKKSDKTSAAAAASKKRGLQPAKEISAQDLPITKKKRVYAQGQTKDKHTMTNCPDCSAPVVKQEGCVSCLSCGYSLCAL